MNHPAPGGFAVAGVMVAGCARYLLDLVHVAWAAAAMFIMRPDPGLLRPVPAAHVRGVVC